MARQAEIRYVNFYMAGSAAYDFEPRPIKKEVKLPKQRRKGKIVLHVDPMAVLGICVAFVMSILMIVGAVRLGIAKNRADEMENYVRTLQTQNAELRAQYEQGYDLEEIRQIGDRITVLKDGKSTASGLKVTETSRAELVRLMTGRDVENVFPPRKPLPADAPVALEVEDLELQGEFRKISFQLRAGEILGFAGLVGSKRSEILETICGVRKPSAGKISVNGKRLRPGSVPAAVKAGIGLSPEERKSQGLILDEPLFKNVTLPTFERFARRGYLNEKAEREAARDQITALELRPADPDRPTRTLSGGNQQKILLARWVVHGTPVLLLDEPTRGVDVGARAEIYNLIRRLAEDGTAIIVVSSEIEEVLGLADKVLVIDDGNVLAETNPSDITEHGVLDLIMKGSAA